MTFRRQLVDALVAVAIAFALSIPLDLVAYPIGTRVGLIAGVAYYFSRNPWGSPEGDRLNDRVDAVYDAYLPFET